MQQEIHNRISFRVSCDPQYGFKVQNHDEEEVSDIVIAHAKKTYTMDITAKEVKANMKAVATKDAEKMK